MIKRASSHFRANVVAYLALFVALSGTALAAQTLLPKNSVGTKQLKKRAVSGPKVKGNTLTGRTIKESSLARVPRAGFAANANRFDGIDSAVFGTTDIHAGVHFEPRDSSTTEKIYVSTGAVRCGSVPADFHDRLALPQGARITSLDYAFIDNAPGSNSGLEIVGFDTLGLGGLSSVTLASVASDGAENERRVVTTTLATPQVIDNTRRAYSLVWSPFVCGLNTQLVGAAVHYTLPAG